MKMCKKCVKVENPDRDTVCIENGSYMVNFAGCAECGKKEEIKVMGRQVDTSEEDEESIQYQHICENCDHVIGNHEYRFYLQDKFQEYEMNCLLCGHGEDSRSVLPNDPRQQPQFVG